MCDAFSCFRFRFCFCFVSLSVLRYSPFHLLTSSKPFYCPTEEIKFLAESLNVRWKQCKEVVLHTTASVLSCSRALAFFNSRIAAFSGSYKNTPLLLYKCVDRSKPSIPRAIQGVTASMAQWRVSTSRVECTILATLEHHRRFGTAKMAGLASPTGPIHRGFAAL